MPEVFNVSRDAPELGYVRVSVRLAEGGRIGTFCEYEGLSIEQAIGHMTVVLDRMKEEASFAWMDGDAMFPAVDEEDDDEDPEEYA